MKKVSLVKLKDNQKGVIVELNVGHGLINRFMSMGIYKGREITKLSQFALRGPLAIRVGRSILALGFGMASKIIVDTHD
jgi:Fe2+ transport system protein FeoA